GPDRDGDVRDRDAHEDAGGPARAKPEADLDLLLARVLVDADVARAPPRGGRGPRLELDAARDVLADERAVAVEHLADRVRDGRRLGVVEERALHDASDPFTGEKLCLEREGQSARQSA